MISVLLLREFYILWVNFGAVGIPNTLKIFKQFTYFIFFKCSAELEVLDENKMRRFAKAISCEKFPLGRDARGCKFAGIRLSRHQEQLLGIVARLTPQVDQSRCPAYDGSKAKPLTRVFHEIQGTQA